MASLVFEVECEIDGELMPAEPDVGITGAWVDDLDLSSVCMTVRQKNGTYKNIDLLDGISPTARDQVIRNILAVYGDEAEEEFLNDQ